MTPFTTHSGLVAPMKRSNVDTDQIIPKQFLKRIERTGFGQFLFYDWRFDGNGNPNPDFVLNQSPYNQASILLTGANFGCGSSREHAPWALADFGFRAIIGPSFADIFSANCLQNGLLLVVLPQAEVDQLFEMAADDSLLTLTISLEDQTVRSMDGQFEAHFSIDTERKAKLLAGLDPIGETLLWDDAIRRFETAHTPAPVPAEMA